MTYTPKRLQSQNQSQIQSQNKSNTIKQIYNEDFDINNQNLFPNLISSSVNKNIDNQSIINWNNISKNITDDPIKELDKKNNNNNKLLQKNNIILESINDNKIIIDKIKSNYVDESGWTHIVKSNKPTYKEKKKKNKNIDDIDNLIKTVIKI